MSARDDFFVGYLPMPPRLRWFSLGFAGFAVLLAGILALAVALTQGHPGEGLRPHEAGRSFRGVLLERPYPHLRYVDENGAFRTLLFTSSGKSGIEVANGGGSVTVTGTLLERDGTRLMAGPEFAPIDGSDVAFLPRLRGLTDIELGHAVLEGEIVDSKCYLGAMRPGGGAAHRACAQMCIAGGIPPILVLREADGRERHVLLCSADEMPVNDLVLPFVAEPVRCEGELIRRAGLPILRLAPDGITRR
ncbi:MAG: hypothetical protein R3F20_15405 [Planctomycetota bacterium]